MNIVNAVLQIYIGRLLNVFWAGIVKETAEHKSSILIDVEVTGFCQFLGLLFSTKPSIDPVAFDSRWSDEGHSCLMLQLY